MNAVERRIACGCEQQSGGLIGGADGGRTHDLRIANAARIPTQVTVGYSPALIFIVLNGSVPSVRYGHSWRF